MNNCKGYFGLSETCNICTEKEFCYQLSTGDLTSQVPNITQSISEQQLIIELEKVFNHHSKIISIIIMRINHKKFTKIAKHLKLSSRQIYNYMADIQVIHPQIYKIIKNISTQK